MASAARVAVLALVLGGLAAGDAAAQAQRRPAAPPAPEPPPPAAPAAPAEPPAAILQGLDKITGRVQEIAAPVGAMTRFGSLEITVRACRKRPPEEPPDNIAFLEIADHKPGEQAVALFRGWMFSSSPALSALEHAVYDVWVIDCRSATPAASRSR